MTALLTVVAVVFFSSGCWFGISALVMAIQILLYGAGVPAGFAVSLGVAALVLAVPFAAMLAGLVLDRFCFPVNGVKIFRQAAILLALLMLLSENLLFDYLEAGLRITAEHAWRDAIAFCAACGSAIIFCAGLMSISLMLLAGLVEALMRWFGEASGYSRIVTYSALRPLLVITGASIAINLISGLFVAELSPAAILDRLI